MKRPSRKKVTLKKNNKTGVAVHATYDSASTHDNNSGYWRYTDGLDAISANTESVRKTIRERSRFEFDNNSYCQGILKTIAKDTIGKNGAMLRLNGNTVQHDKLEADFTAWQKEIHYSEKLRLMRMAKAKDGESWLLLVTKSKLKNPVKLYVQLFETEQVGSYRNTNKQKDGVYIDKFGEAEAFNLYDEHPSMGGSQAGKRVPVESLIQYANITRAGQLRGIPETTPVLTLFSQLRAYSLSVLTASETASNLSAVLTTTASVEDECDDVEPEFEFTLNRNSIKTMPFGWSISQLKAEQPTNSYVDFKREVLNEIARTLEIPYNIASLNSSGYNYASGRLDFQEYWKALDVEQGIINSTINDVIFEAYFKEWAILNNAKDLDLTHNWVYDSRPHVDPVKEANAERIRIETGTMNLAQACAKDGNDWRDVVDQRVKEETYVKEQRDSAGLIEEGNDEKTKD